MIFKNNREIIKNSKKLNSFIGLLVFLFAFVGTIVTIGVTSYVHASKSGSLDIQGLTVTESTTGGSWNLSGTTATGSATGTAATSGCNSKPAASATGALTFKNTKGETAQFSFSYTLTLNGGSASIGGNSVTSNGKYGPVNLANNGTVVVSITSAVGASTTTINMSGIALVVDKQVTGHFLPVADSTRGSYTVDSTAVGTSTVDITKSSTQAFSLVATAKSGYQFFGWHISTSQSTVDSSTISSSAATFSYSTDNTTFYVRPEFIRASSALFLVDGVTYHDLNVAASKASSSKPIILSNSGTLYSNSTGYTIPSNITLLIPKDANHEIVTTAPSTVDASTSPSAFRTLTIGQNVNITVNGNICLAANQYKSNGRTSGACGMIKFVDNSNSTITLKSGSILYAWGYIWGNSGRIIAESGSKVYESFNLHGWRGGNATSDILGNSYKVFPVNQFYVQNVEVDLDVYAGSQVYVRTAITVSLLGTKTATVNFMGADGMFKITSGYVNRRYNPSVDTFEVVAHGSVTISPMKISISGYSMDSTNYVLPIPSAFSIKIANGATVTTNQDLVFLPGSKMVIDAGGKLNITNSKSVYFVDMDEWGPYAYPKSANNGRFTTVWYTPNSAARHTKTSIGDAELDLNGTVTVAGSAGLYTTTGGANIHSSEKCGDITFANGPGSQQYVYFVIQGGKDGNEVSNKIYDGSGDYPSGYVPASVTNAKLKNGDAYIGTDEEYYLTDEVEAGYNVTYNDIDDKWGEKPALPEEYTVTFYDPKTNRTTTKQRTQGQTIDLLTWAEASSAGFAYNGYTIKGWIYNNDDFYDIGQTGVNTLIDDNVTLTAYWGGWYTFDSGYKYCKYDSGSSKSFATGLYTIAAGDSHSINNEGGFEIAGGSTCLFDSNGELKTHIDSGVAMVVLTEWMEYIGGSYYHIDKGVLQKGSGLIYLDTNGSQTPDSYYYIDENGVGYMNCIRYLEIEPNSYGLSNGYYKFDGFAKIDLDNPPIPVIIDHNLRLSDGVNDPVVPDRYPHGLFAVYDSSSDSTYLYFIKIDGSVVWGTYSYGNNFIGATFYVTSDMLNNYQIDGVALTEGLYYFDTNGHMYNKDMQEIRVSGNLATKNFVMNSGGSGQ